MFNNINLNSLKYFYEVANTKNITKASENLCMTQPALTRAIKQLESELNTTLFVRNKKGVVLTSEGEILFDYASNIFHSLEKTINVINDTKKNEKHLYIGATTTNFLEPLLNTLGKIKIKYPNVKIEIILDELNILEKYNKLGKLDILIKNNYENIEGSQIITSFEIKDCFIAEKNTFGFLENKTLSLEEILSYPFVLLSSITHGRRNFDSFLKSQGIAYKPDYEFNSYSLCRELIRNGFGIGVGNPIHYQGDEFIILKTNFEIPARKFDICYIKDSKCEILNEFIEELNKDLN